MKTFLLCCLGLTWAGMACSEELAIVDQRDYKASSNACTPASVLNLLKFSGPEYQVIYEKELGTTDEGRLNRLIDRYYRSRKSVLYPSLNRWGVHGIHTADAVMGMNELAEDFGLKPFSASYLDRKEGELVQDHIERCFEMIDRSLKRNVTPILSIRSYVVRHREENDFEPLWEIGRSHSLVIHSIKSEPDMGGFELVALDPWEGKEVELYVHREANGQPFNALVGIQETGTWRVGRPFLLVEAPWVSSVQPRNLKWSERFIITANFLIGDF